MPCRPPLFKLSLTSLRTELSGSFIQRLNYHLGPSPLLGLSPISLNIMSDPKALAADLKTIQDNFVAMSGMGHLNEIIK